MVLTDLRILDLSTRLKQLVIIVFRLKPLKSRGRCSLDGKLPAFQIRALRFKKEKNHFYTKHRTAVILLTKTHFSCGSCCTFLERIKIPPKNLNSFSRLLFLSCHYTCLFSNLQSFFYVSLSI